jgi:MoaA/NifB/PqqE/SkfB family radical SAM enzyme
VAEQISGTQLEGDGYLQQLIQSMRSRGTFPRQACFASILMARIDPWGTVYPCLEQHRAIGSLRESDFRTIWNSPRTARERQRLASERTCSCWFNNTALIGHYGELLSKGPAGMLRALLRNGNGMKG